MAGRGGHSVHLGRSYMNHLGVTEISIHSFSASCAPVLFGCGSVQLLEGRLPLTNNISSCARKRVHHVDRHHIHECQKDALGAEGSEPESC